MKSGIGSHAVQIGELKVGALVAVNALGDVYEWKTGKMVAGMLNGEKNGFRPTVEDMYAGYTVIENKFTGNTTSVLSWQTLVSISPDFVKSLEWYKMVLPAPYAPYIRQLTETVSTPCLLALFRLTWICWVRWLPTSCRKPF